MSNGGRPMLVILACWVVVGAVALPTGCAVLRTLGMEPQGTERLLVAVWIGLLTIAVALLGISLAVPLRPVAAGVLSAVVLTAALAAPAVRADVRAALEVRRLAGVFAVGVPTAFVAASAVTHYDTGLYQLQMTKWLAHAGSAPGLALVHDRFGFTSSWFALHAPFDAGPFAARLVALGNGLTVTVTLLLLWSAVSRAFRGDADRSDRFLLIALPLVLVYAHWNNLIVSASPDLPVAFTVVLVGWRLVASPHRPDPSMVLLAGLAVALKFGAAPLVPIALAVALSPNRWACAHSHRVAGWGGCDLDHGHGDDYWMSGLPRVRHVLGAELGGPRRGSCFYFDSGDRLGALG
jgi:hypothetical protein